MTPTCARAQSPLGCPSSRVPPRTRSALLSTRVGASRQPTSPHPEMRAHARAQPGGIGPWWLGHEPGAEDSPSRARRRRTRRRCQEVAWGAPARGKTQRAPRRVQPARVQAPAPRASRAVAGSSRVARDRASLAPVVNDRHERTPRSCAIVSGALRWPGRFDRSSARTPSTTEQPGAIARSADRLAPPASRSRCPSGAGDRPLAREAD